MGRAVSEDCQPASALLLHPVNPLPSITRSARLNKQRSGDLSLLSPENFGDSAIFPAEKISASLIEILSSRSHKTPACQCPSYPHRGRMNAFATAVLSGPSALRGPLD